MAVRAATRHPGRVTGLILTAGFAVMDNRLRLAAEIWQSLLDGDRPLLAKFLTLAGTSERRLNALSPTELASSVAWLADFIPAGSPEHVALGLAADTRVELAEAA